jgi:hypothetical protein
MLFLRRSWSIGAPALALDLSYDASHLATDLAVGRGLAHGCDELAEVDRDLGLRIAHYVGGPEELDAVVGDEVGVVVRELALDRLIGQVARVAAVELGEDDPPLRVRLAVLLDDDRKEARCVE